MLNQDQMLKKNKTGERVDATSGKITPLKITPLKIERATNTISNRIKELRKPRTRKYINDLAELQAMLISLDRMRKEKKTYSSIHNEKAEPDISEYNLINSPKNNLIDLPAQINHIDIEDSDESFKGQPGHELSLEVVSESILNTVKMEEQIKDSYEAEKEKSKSLIKNSELEDLEKRIEEKLRQMAKEYPLIRDLLSLIYPESEEEYLISCGAIQGPGRAVYNREDMAINVDDPKVAEQLKRGYDVYTQYHDTHNFLCLEIYIDAFCIIYKDGIVKTIE